MANTKIPSELIADNSVGITQLNVSDGTNGQALTTDGSGTLSFASVGVSGISSSADATAITIDSSENVGIGETSPTLGLHVGNAKGVLFGPSGSGTASTYISPDHENTLNGGYGLDTDTGDLWVNYRGYQNGTTRYRDFRVGDGKEGLIAMFDGSSGNVGIGTASPAVSLDVGSKTDAIKVPNGTTAQQPTAATGMIRYNTDDAVLEGYVDGNWMNIKTTDKFPVMTDLYARYTADNFTSNGNSTPPTWNDDSGNNRNISTTSTSSGGGFWDRSGSTWPTLVTNSANTNGATKEFKCVEFDNTEALALPDSSGIASGASSGFTFAYVARYKDGSTDYRIMDGKGDNNLFGAWGGSRGVFFDGSWVVGSATQHSTDPFDWFIVLGNHDTVSSKTKDNNSGGWVSYGTTASPAGWNYVSTSYSATGNRYGLNRGNYGINGTSGEDSDFQIAEWCMWNRKLSATEMSTMQSYLETKYGI